MINDEWHAWLVSGVKHTRGKLGKRDGQSKRRCDQRMTRETDGPHGGLRSSARGAPRGICRAEPFNKLYTRNQGWKCEPSHSENMSVKKLQPSR